MVEISLRPLISCVMATYNGEAYIAEAIQSVLNQTYTDFEFIIVDDGSTDSTARIIQNFKDERIVYIKKEKNSGIADSLNIGIESSKGAFIARMDDDDVCLSKRFEKQLEVFNDKPELIFCGTNVQNLDGGKPNSTPEFHEDILLKLFFFKNPIFHPTVMIRKSVLLKQKYNSDMVPAEDQDLWSRLIFEGTFYQIQQPLVCLRYHANSITVRKRHVQLKHNIKISKDIYKKIGFKTLKNHDLNLSIMASHNYTIKGAKLREVINWINQLKEINKEQKRFSETAFNKEADIRIDRFIKSYFANNKLSKKIIPFLYLDMKNKKQILTYYAKKMSG